MLKLGTIVTVILVSWIPSHGLRLQQKDILHLLEFLKVKDDLETRQQEIEDKKSDDNPEVYNSMEGLLKKMEVIDLIEKADKDASKNKFGEIKLATDELQKDEYGDYDMEPVNRGHDKEEPVEFPKRIHHALTPNNLLGNDDGYRDSTDPLSEYSKVYIVLDPGAMGKSQKKDALSELISRIALSPSFTGIARQNRERNRKNRFKVKSNRNSRRYRRESREGYDDEEYRPARNRHEEAGNGGRTGIPYMRPRGDIYEKN